MGARIKALVFPCGTENGGEIHDALRHSLHVDMIGASSLEDHGRFRFPRYFGGLPRIGEAGFDEAFSALLRREGVGMVFATHDTVAEYLAPRVQGMGTHLVNGDPETASVTRRKSRTYRLFADCGWAPRVFDTPEAVTDWPAVVKPDRGQGGQGVAVARDIWEARLAMAALEEPVVMEHLPGAEVTVDCFTDRHRRLVWAGPRTRERVRAGIAMRSEAVEPDEAITGIAERINARLVMRGPWFFQLRQDRDGRWKLLEVACRVAGTMVAQRARGVNLPLMAVHDFMGRDVVPLPSPHVRLVERRIATRARLDWAFDEVFVDLDDTLVADGRAVPGVVAFLYQCAGEGKRLHLVTRHAGDPEEALRRARIAPGLFDAIHHLRAGEPKAGVIGERAIFVDNHFPERAAVAAARGIPVLDVDAVEFLLR
ncbi:ATP-grasp domain-containing protein [Roseomonas populi]|uniref:ATP-grasp domain-containing protein n=1 Tax=Roseomonas populi TaxID=3121582 RepID=A0ABT1X5S8_9PROT|nr:ATP-grasp domain-containing protein [Roseomonas pecuniae]MCR0983451.1 ATP-grasp domain-containing protein [Roseomonas pecuniae]